MMGRCREFYALTYIYEHFFFGGGGVGGGGAGLEFCFSIFWESSFQFTCM